jgi:mono/diheme cytochrome c family protein
MAAGLFRMLAAVMPRGARRFVVALAALGAGGALAACGSEGIQLAANAPDHRGAEIFDTHCSACHTLDVAGAQGSTFKPNDREYKDGPNFNVRKEQKSDILYAIRNGGFSSGPMPQDIVVGSEAQAVADFLAKYSGRDASRAPTPNQAEPAGETAGSSTQ